MARKKPEDAKPDAWMPFYVGEFLRETALLPVALVGAYTLLRAALWEGGGRLPMRSELLRTAAKMAPDEWRDAWPLLFPLFEDRGDHLTHRRLTPDYEQAVTIYQKKSAAGVAGAAKRWGTDGKPIAPAMADALAGGMADPMHNNNHSHKGSSNELPTGGADGSFEPPAIADDFQGLVDAARMNLRGAGMAAVALRKAGVQVTSQNPDLLAAITAGVTVDHLLELAELHKGKPIRYLTSAAMRELAERPTGDAIPASQGGDSSSPRRAAPPSRTDGVSPRKVETAATRLEGAQSYASGMREHAGWTPEQVAAYLKPYEDAANAAQT